MSNKIQQSIVTDIDDSEIWNKQNAHQYILPSKQPDYVFSMVKHGIIQKNRRRFWLYSNQYILCFQDTDTPYPSSHFKKIMFIDNDLRFKVKMSQDMQITGIKFYKFNQKSYLTPIHKSDKVSLQTLISLLKTQIFQKGFQKKISIINICGQGTFSNTVAVKIIKKSKLSEINKGKEIIDNEIKILRSLQHPNILKLYEVFDDSRHIYMITSYYDQENLLISINKHIFYSLPKIRLLIRGLLETLLYLKSQNIIHRDIKPENIIFDRKNQRPMLIDFGLSQKMNQEFIYKKCGSPSYFAPEIMTDAQYDFQVDIFSLGVVAHILILQKPVFRGKNSEETYYLNKKCAIDFSGSLYADMDPDILDFLQKMLAKDPTQRLTAAEALEHPFLSFHQQDLNLQNLQKIQENRASFQQKVSQQLEKSVMMEKDSIESPHEQEDQIHSQKEQHYQNSSNQMHSQSKIQTQNEQNQQTIQQTPYFNGIREPGNSNPQTKSSPTKQYHQQNHSVLQDSSEDQKFLQSRKSVNIKIKDIQNVCDENKQIIFRLTSSPETSKFNMNWQESKNIQTVQEEIQKRNLEDTQQQEELSKHNNFIMEPMKNVQRIPQNNFDHSVSIFSDDYEPNPV